MNLLVSKLVFSSIQAYFKIFSELILLKNFILDALDLSHEVRENIGNERTKYLTVLFQIIVERHNTSFGVQKYGNMLMMSQSIQVIFVVEEKIFFDSKNK